MMLDLHTTAVLEHLTDAGLLIGDGAPPDGGGWAGPPRHSEFVRYGILWRLGSQDERSLTLEDRFEVATPSFFIRVFGPDRTSTDEIMDAVRQRMLHEPMTVPGRIVHRVRLDNSQTTTRSTSAEVAAGAHEAGDFYTVRTTPA